ncbi:unnamed protein product, partial [Porites evermanni]
MLQELAKLDTKTRKFMTMYKTHHPKSDVDRLYLPRTEEGVARHPLPLCQPAIPAAEDEVNTTYACSTKAKAKHQGRQLLRSKWELKALQCKYPQLVKQSEVDQDKTHRWLKAAGLKVETKGFIIAAQDQSLPTCSYQHNILKKPDLDPKCRLWGCFDEIIDHLVFGCPE